MAQAIGVNVRALAEFFYESGDLAPDALAISRMLEGAQGHRALQTHYEAPWQAEVPLRLECAVQGETLVVSGRADGVCLTPDAYAVEEIKTLTAEQAMPEDGSPVHWAQAQVYAHIIACTQGAQTVNVHLTYYRLSGARTRFTRTRTAAELADFFAMLTVPYVDFVRQVEARREETRASCRTLGFPFSGYRAGQREIARNAYIALRARKKLLVRAPTGIGKTAAALFPAMKALGEGMLETVFYLTARSTARLSAETALAQMRADGLRARSVTIYAREKICPQGAGGCRSETCPLAKGYFDRRRQALLDALAVNCFDRDGLLAFAEAHQVCPFEISLDISEMCDVIICDYNYAFDPSVHLKRYFDARGEYALLIDEAHNLAPRVADMLSGVLSPAQLAALRRETGRVLGRRSDLYRALTKLLTILKALNEPALPRVETQVPETLAETVTAAVALIREALDAGAGVDGLRDALRDLAGFCRAAALFDEKTHRALMQAEGKRARLNLRCYDSAPAIQAVMKRVRGSVLFSATLAPMAYYAERIGLNGDAGDACLSLPSPFPPENLLVLQLDIDARYRERDRSASDVAEAIYQMAAAHTGNYVAFFPSYQYLVLVAEHFAQAHPQLAILRQEAQMDEDARQALLDCFVPQPQHTLVAFLVLGGVFSEGVDLPGDRLSGAAIVSIALPQVGFDRDTAAAFATQNGQDGYLYAYLYPGVEKCLQAAGRVIRTETDRGVVLLLDSRFRQARVAALLPEYYCVRHAQLATLRARLTDFWREAPSAKA